MFVSCSPPLFERVPIARTPEPRTVLSFSFDSPLSMSCDMQRSQSVLRSLAARDAESLLNFGTDESVAREVSALTVVPSSVVVSRVSSVGPLSKLVVSWYLTLSIDPASEASLTKSWRSARSYLALTVALLPSTFSAWLHCALMFSSERPDLEMSFVESSIEPPETAPREAMQMTLYTAGFDLRGSRGSMCIAECDAHGERRRVAGVWGLNHARIGGLSG